MQDIEESDVAGKSRQRLLHVVQAELDVLILLRGDLAAVTNFARIDVQAEHGMTASALAEIEGEQPNAATDIEDRILRVTQQFVGAWINPIVPQLASHVMAKPALLKLRRHPRTRIFVVWRVSTLRFHLLRIIALPD